MVVVAVNEAEWRGVVGGHLSPSVVGVRREEKKRERKNDDAGMWALHFSFSLTCGFYIFLFLLIRMPR